MATELENILNTQGDIDNLAASYMESKKSGFNVRDLAQSDILKILNGAYIAERFFGRTRSWFCQKMNNHVKNGKPIEFTEDEWRKLKLALNTIAWEIQEFADNM